MILTRIDKREDGIWGMLYIQERFSYSKLFCYTLEHSYPVNGDFLPKIPEGKYLCVKGTHRLEGMTHDFETFEVTGVIGHTGLLFHKGNYNSDSSGCILIGQDIEHIIPNHKTRMLTESGLIFSQFMDCLKGIEKFNLTIQNRYQTKNPRGDL